MTKLCVLSSGMATMEAAFLHDQFVARTSDQLSTKASLFKLYCFDFHQCNFFNFPLHWGNRCFPFVGLATYSPISFPKLKDIYRCAPAVAPTRTVPPIQPINKVGFYGF